MARSGSSSSIPASPSRRRVVHRTPPPLPPALCYLCGGGTVRTWVVEDPESYHLGKRFYKCPCFHETDQDCCRFGFMWHDDYRLILEEMGVIPATQNQNLVSGRDAASTSNEALIPRPMKQIGAPTYGRRNRKDDSNDGGWILKALLALSVVQTLIALMTYART